MKILFIVPTKWPLITPGCDQETSSRHPPSASILKLAQDMGHPHPGAGRSDKTELSSPMRWFPQRHLPPGHAGAADRKAPRCPADRTGDGAARAAATANHPGPRTRLERWVTRIRLEELNVFAPVTKAKGDSKTDRPETAGQ